MLSSQTVLARCPLISNLVRFASLVWIVGYFTGSYFPSGPQVTPQELAGLTQELKFTRFAVEDTRDNTCQLLLHTEIRYSTSLRSGLQLALVLQAALYLCVCCKKPRPAQQAVSQAEKDSAPSSSDESRSSSDSGPLARRGPLRPSDLNSAHVGYPRGPGHRGVSS